MRKAINRMTLVLIGLAIILLATSVFIASGQTLVSDNYTSYAEDPTLIVIDETNLNSIATNYASGNGTSGSPYIITTAGQFVKAMKEGNNHYRLERNVLLTSTTNLAWNPVANFTGNFDGNNKTITYAASTSTGGENFGLFLANSGTIRNVNYVFSGYLSRNGQSNYGSFVGYNGASGIIGNCSFNINGMIIVKGNADNQTIIAGGIIGRNLGMLRDSTININADIESNTYVEDSYTQINTVAYSGGVAGYNSGYIEDCEITILGSIVATNNHYRQRIWLIVWFATGDFSGALFSAGGVIGYANAGTITRCNIVNNGSVGALGNEAYYGVSGGIVGYSEGTFNIIKSSITLGGVVQTFSADEETLNLYVGGLVGRLMSADGSFRDNVVKLNITKENLTDGKVMGCLLGQGDFGIWNKGNVWLIYDIRTDIGAFVGRGVTGQTQNIVLGQTHNIMDIRGSGTVNGSVNSATGAITLKAVPEYSPLYGWMSNAAGGPNGFINGTYPSGTYGKVDPNGTGEYYPQISTSGARYEALFLKTQINKAGDLNVLADLTATGANWTWINIVLQNDILATGQYTPIGSGSIPFRGTFDGGNHKITFTSTALIRGVDTTGLFGVNNGTIKNINIAFGGEIRAKNEAQIGGAGAFLPKDTDLYAGMLAGINRGTISNIRLLTTSGSQIRGFQTTAGRYSAVGGLIGKNESGGKIINAHVTIQGKVHAAMQVAGAIPCAGGLVGITEVRPGGILTQLGYMENISLAIEGEIAAFDKDLTNTTMYTGGLVGYNINYNDFVLRNVSIAIKKTGIFGNPGVGGQGNGNNIVGAISSHVITGSTTFTMENVWVILDKREEEDIDGIKIYGNDTNKTVTRGENRLYISGGIIQAAINPSTGQISMSVPIGAGEIFAGWFLNADFTGMIKTNAEGVYGNEFRPNINYTSIRRYTIVITSIIYNYDQLAKVSSFTNQGNSFQGENFILGANIDIGSSHVPIGNSPLNKFQGTFNGGGLIVYISNINRTNIAGQPSVAGLFGYVGANALIYGFNIVVNGTIGSQTQSVYSGVLAAYNEGTIGLNSPSQKTKILIIADGVIQGLNAGGIVAYNSGTIYNIEVTIDQGAIEAGDTSSSYTHAGGAVAINDTIGIVKNIYIKYLDNSAFVANGNDSIAGGAVGLNRGHLHSIVVEMRNTEDSEVLAQADKVGGVLGNNNSANTSNLWMVINNNSDGILPPEGTDINHTNFAGANQLVLYGPGTIEITVEANPIGDTSGLGGMIIFKSVTNSLSGTRAFYGYMYDLETGDLLNNNVGVTDYIFTPTTTMRNKIVYTVFALSKIRTLADLIQVSSDVNSGINPRIIYNLLNNITITGAYTPIGTDSNPFHGIFKGNQKTITIGAGAPSIIGIFGTIAEQGRVEFVNVTVNSAAVALTGTDVGTIASNNNGTISNVSVVLNQKIIATNAAGGIAGINNGTITAAIVNLKYTTITGIIYEGSITGANYAGGISGINNGTIGCTTVQDIKVIFDNGAKINTTANNSSAGGVTGINNSGSLIMSAFLTINGIITATGSGTNTSVGGIAGKNIGDIHTIFILIEGQGVLSGATAIGLVAGTNSGTIGLESGNFNNINAGIYKNITGVTIGGLVGVMTSAGKIFNVFLTINANISGTDCAGGLVGEVIRLTGETTNGNISNIDLTLGANYFINGILSAGGLVGNNSVSASISNSKVIINGLIKCEGTPNVIASESKAGGVAGINNGLMTNVLVTLKKDVIATYKGSIAGISGVNLGSNVWVLLSNSIYTDVSTTLNTGYNSLKIVGEASFKVGFNESYAISFEVMSSTTSFYKWYSNISNGDELFVGITYDGITNIFTPQGQKNSKFHISFYDLDIDSAAEFKEMANYINHNNLFHNVKFKLSVNINITGSVVPIGTEQYPFNGIFDGNGKTITFASNSSIGAVAYSGLFGYTSENSMLYNFILDIQKNVIIGGQSPIYTGALVGYSKGNIKDILVKLASTPRASSINRIGGIAGYFNPAETTVNTWLIVHNASCPATSNTVESGINTMNIIGTGDLDVKFELGPSSTFSFTVPIDTDYEDTFVNWYGNISTQTLLKDLPAVGVVNSIINKNNSIPDDDTIYYKPNKHETFINKSFAISFIKLNLYNYSDLKNFSSNINTYSGFNGVQFILHNNILIDDDNFVPIGTKNNPFSGIFEGNGKTISFAGKSIYGSYPGLFGYINSYGNIKNLIVISNTTTTPNTFGDNNAIYTGLLASYCDGLLLNVIAQVKSETTIFCVNKAGGMVGAIGDNFSAVNAWVLLEENSPIKASGIPESDINILYTAGNGFIALKIEENQITFIATKINDSTEPFYGYIDDTTTVNDKAVFTPDDDLKGARYTAIFLNTDIDNYTDLVKLAETINSGLNYSGVVYSLKSNIEIANGYVPIGGLVGSRIVKFKGIFNGDGYTITIPTNVTITGAYAGIFGYVDSNAEVKNLRMEVKGTVGNSLSIYSGSVAGYNDGIMENIAISVDKTAVHNGSTGESGYTGYSSTIAKNVWLINYNSKDVVERNLIERNNGLNSFTILGAGDMNINFIGNYNIVITKPYGDSILKEWFYYEGEVKTQLQSSDSISYTAASNLTNKIYYISFLNTVLEEYNDLLMLANDVNNGYDFYGISFTLNEDITLEQGFPGIGGTTGSFSGNFLGNNKTITLPIELAITGDYAGIFGKINQFGTVSNLKINLDGTLGNEQTRYAGAFAYNAGRIDNCIVVGYTAILNINPNDPTAYSGTVVGYDVNSLIFNTWGIIASYNNIAAVGVASSGVNKLKVVGAGRITSEFNDNSIRFANDTEYNSETDISGWYRNYASGAIISNHLGIGEVKDNDQTYLPSLSVLNAEYEVIIIKSVIECENDLNVLANDINIGGYDFKNVTFIVSANFTITDTSILIGKENSPFRGILDGNNMTITILGDKGIFEYNSGTIKNLNVNVIGNILSDNEAGAIAYINNGIINACNVTVGGGASIIGITTGAMVGINNGTIINISKVIIMPSAKIEGEIVGGAVGISNGNTSDIEVLVQGDIKGLQKDSDTVYAGGAIGFVREGVTRRIISTVTLTATISTEYATIAYAGGLVGRNRSVMSDSVLFGTYNVVTANGATSVSGEFAGISNSNIANSWMVMRSYNGIIKSVGDGPQSINLLTIYGNGNINLFIDRNHGNILFYKEDNSSSTIDGWYITQDVAVSENPILGNVSLSGEDYAPSPKIMGRKISVVFINTQIFTIADLIDLADSVNGGMSSRYIEFTLQNDIDITEALPESIGTSLNGFNFVFNGQNYSINIHNNSYSLFGYIGSAGIVTNLNVVIYGTIGNSSTIYAGGLAAENEGLINECSVSIVGQGKVIANTSGGVVGRNYSNGIIKGVNVSIMGSLESTGALETNRVGGIAGRNDGVIKESDNETTSVMIYSTGMINSYGSVTSYAGGIVGQNAGIISNSRIDSDNGNIVASCTGPFNSFAGGISATNTGTLSLIIANAENLNITASGTKLNYAGVITGSNKYEIKSVIAYVGNGSKVNSNIKDTGVGLDDSGATSSIKNSWIIGNSLEAKSTTAAVNNMLAIEANAEVILSEEKFNLGIIEFKITKVVGYFAVYDNITVPLVPSVYLTDVVNNVFTPSESAKGYVVSVRNSNSISSGSELKAFSLAYNSDASALLTSAVISLYRDIELSGEYSPIGTFSNKFTGTFNGDGNKITVLADTVFTGVEGGGETYAGIFGFANGTINNLIIDIKGTIQADRVAPIAIQNFGTINNCVTYIVEGNLIGNISKGTTVVNNTNTMNNVWTITDDTTLTASYGKLILIRGQGYIETEIIGTLIEFTAIELEDNLLAGWAHNYSFVSNENSMLSTALPSNSYSVEFVSLLIGEQTDLENLARLLPMGLLSEGIEFIQTNDITLSGLYSALGTLAAPFNGIYNGNGYVITINNITINGQNAGIFGNIGNNGVVENLIIQLESLSAPLATNTAALAGISSGTINNVVIYVIADVNHNIVIGSDLGSDINNVWIITNDSNDTTGTTAGIIVIIGEGNILSVIDTELNEVTMTADTSNTDGIFAGWYYEEDIYSFEEVTLMNDSLIGTYEIIFITSLISTEEQYIDLTNAVNIGFDFEGYELSLLNDIILTTALVIGNENHSFNGIFNGSGYSITINANYIGEYAGLFAINNGTITNLIAIFNGEIGSSDTVYAGSIACINNGTISNVLSLVYGDVAGDNAGGISANTTEGTISNSWYVSSSATNASNDALKGNTLLLNNCDMVVEQLLNGEFALTAITNENGKFVVWYSNSDYSSVLTEGVILNEITLSSILNGVNYAVRAIDTINLLGELLVFSKNVNYGNSFETFEISLGSDIVITDCTYEPIGMEILNTFAGTFNGNGNSITIAEDMSIGGSYSGVFGVNEGIILDLIVYLYGNINEGIYEQGTVVGLNEGILLNIAVYIYGNIYNNNAVAGITSSGTLNNCWYIVGYSDEWIYLEPAHSITVMGNGSIISSFNEGNLIFTATVTEGIYFAGWTEGIDLDVTPVLDTSITDANYLAEFIDLHIEEEADFINLARVIDIYGFDTTGITFEVMNDIETTENYVTIGNPLTAFSGSINGNFNLINLNVVDENNFYGFIGNSNDATIQDLAFSRDTEFATYVGDVVVGNGLFTSSNVVLLTPIFSMTAGDNIELVIVGDTGDISTGYYDISYDEVENAFKVTAIPNVSADYDLRGFYNELYERLDNDTYDYYVPSSEGNKITMKFKLRFRVTFELAGIPSGEAPINTPVLSGAGLYWFGEDDVTLEVVSIGNGYLFRGIRLASTIDNLSTTTFTYTFPSPSEHQDYIAQFELISFAYLSMVYNADRQDQEISNINIVGLSITYMYEGIDGTIYAANSTAPIDVGKYKVTASLTNLNSDLIGIRTVGYQITPAPLSMIVLNILDKDYDTNANAEVNSGTGSIVFAGIKTSAVRTDLATDISLANITFAFSSANAGTWNIIVSNNTLSSANESKTYLNYWFGTELNQIVMRGASPITATIHPLEINVMATTNMIKIYGEPDPKFTYVYLNGSNQPYEGDNFTGSLSREKGENVGIYKINRGTLNLSSNYLLSLYTTGAELTINRRIVDISINPASKQYGAVDPIFTYKDISTEPSTGIVGADKLIFKWNYPRNALPSTTPYNVEALFNPITNPNYDIVSNMQKSDNGITSKYIVQNVFTVTKRNVHVSVTGNNSKVYGAQDTAIKISYTNNLIGDNIYPVRVAGENTGNYAISYIVTNSSGNVTDRYNIITNNNDVYYFTITPKIIYVIPAPVVKTYGEDGEELIPFNAVLPQGVEISGNLTRGQGNNVGEYPIKIDELTVSDSNYELRLSGQEKFIITSRVLTVTLTNEATKIYGYSDPNSVPFQVTGFAPGDESIEVVLTSLNRISAGETIGDYSISANFDLIGDTSINYQVNVIPGLMTIEKREITIATSTSTSMIYGATNVPMINVTIVNGELAGEDSILTLGLVYQDYMKMGAGTHSIIPVSNSNDNYTIETIPGTITITKRNVTITVESITKTAGEDDPKYKYSLSGKLIGKDNFTGSLSREEGEKAGTYVITKGNLSLNNNYTLSIELNDATLTIERAPVSLGPIAVAGGGGAALLGLGFGVFTILRKLKIAKIPV